MTDSAILACVTRAEMSAQHFGVPYSIVEADRYLRVVPTRNVGTRTILETIHPTRARHEHVQ